ncbi:hypothetical protein B0A52_09110 [Exophiala mesophila]|uniref:Early meiotic induction protein 1 n=1 Tax=Exophiala mesophila TaxID=212818 RepID=A0A438MUE8_EXOME|nr:hypothetical protein B0A52_09110 [Exophiala mesophila]
MGWLWASKPSPESEQAPVKSEFTEEAAASRPAASNSSPVQDPPTKKPLSRDEQSALEWANLLKEFQADESRSSAKRVEARTAAEPTLDVSPDSLYPTTMTCQSAFNYAMFCNMFSGQFLNVYRYGEFRSCSNHWDDFWLCMRTRTWADADRAKAIQDHYRKKAVKYKMGPSSEDVWELRTEPLKDAMQGNLEELEARTAAWKAANPNAPDPFSNERQIEYEHTTKNT